MDKQYNIANSRAEKFLQGYMQTRVDMINATTRAAVQKALEADDPQAAVRHVFEVARTSRAKLIADTEVVRASNWAAVDAGKWVGELDFKRWVTQEDAHVRHDHREMQDQVVPWNDPFEAPNGSKAQWPGGFVEPALSIGCRCAALPARAKQTKALGDYGDAVALYDDVRAPHVEALQQAWRAVFDEQEAAVLAEL